ncbi:sorting nexin-27-like [Watersipora subatra]|uniref:sorting nexin-27-like n=1 Tax=Watersipora subatra TaxID=2589382 RepID=UPI00355BD277
MAEEEDAEKGGNFNKVTSEPREVIISKIDTGFGFNVRGQITEGGQMKSINGELYAPLQHVSAVLGGGAAEQAGLLVGDRILAVNGEDVEGATHKTVVDCIRSGGDKLQLLVIAAPQDVPVLRDSYHSDDSNDLNYDYTERRTLPISIPDYQTIDSGTDKFVVYNIYMSGKLLCSKRYSQFVDLHNSLKKQFLDFIFPKLPGKWPFSMSDQQLDNRRRGLETYIEKVSAIKVIAEHRYMQEFLASDEEPEALNQNGRVVQHLTKPNSKPEIRIQLPDRSICTVCVSPDSTAQQVYSLVTQKMDISEETAMAFSLFQLLEDKFIRLLLPDERVHEIYIENYTNGEVTCIVMKRWMFNTKLESRLCRDETALSYMFWEGADAVARGFIQVDEHNFELKALRDSAKADKEKQIQYLKVIRKLPGYGEIVFPFCKCDARKDGFVVISVGFRNLKLHACDNNGALEGNVIEFHWSNITTHDISHDLSSFYFQYEREGKKPRTIKVFTPHYVFLKSCIDKALEEINTVTAEF